MDNKPLKVVYVDDDADDCFLFEAAIAQASPASTLTVMNDSAQAIEKLQFDGGQYDLIFLDLNMPVKSGIDVLRELQQAIAKNKLRIIILTTSGSDANIRTTYELGAALYVQKPTDFDAFVSLLNTLSSRAATMQTPASIQDYIFKN